MTPVIGRVHSFQSMGTLDGPGVRFVVFTQGCNLRCGCCHNPDTWAMSEGKEYSADDIVRRVVRYREYFREEGGITVSGGEPLMQAEFVCELFRLCHEEGINTCLDTSGSIMNAEVEALLAETDRVLLDIKYTNDEQYREYAGCGLECVLDFLGYLDSRNIPVTLRQVIIPTLNDTEENIRELKRIAEAHRCVDKVELLPFRKICQVKYDKMEMPFRFAYIPEPSKETMEKLNSLIAEK